MYTFTKDCLIGIEAIDKETCRNNNFVPERPVKYYV